MELERIKAKRDLEELERLKKDNDVFARKKQHDEIP